MILCIGTTPAAQRVMVFRRLALDRVNRAVTTLDGAAGKSVNVAKVLQVLGAHPVATGFLGGPRGEVIRAILEARGVEVDFLNVSSPTRECVTVIDEEAGTVTELVEESRPVDPDDYGKLLQIVAQRVKTCRAVVLSGTIASGGPSSLYLQVTRLAHEAGALAIADASGPPLLEALQASPDLVKPNRAELEVTFGRPLERESDLRAAMLELHQRGACQLVVTAGPEPALAFAGGKFWRVRSPKIKAFNPIGSGDAFTAALVWRLTEGDALDQACRWASATGAANALTPMAGEVRREDVDRLLDDVVVELV